MTQHETRGAHADIPDFSAAATQILQFLGKRLGFQTWALTRVADKDWIVVETSGIDRRVVNGDIFEWKDTLCYQMVAGNGPHIVPDVDAIAPYVSTAQTEMLDIHAYIGIPILRRDGSLFGTLCAFDSRPAPEEIVHELPLLQLFAGLLGSLLELDARLVEQMRETDAAEADAMRDPLTGLHNRRGWELLITAEEQRALRHGHAMAVLSIDLDGLKFVNDSRGHDAGDDYIRRAADAIRAATRPQDIVCRLGGDEFAALLVDFPHTALGNFLERLEATAKQSGISLSTGSAFVNSQSSIADALKIADEAMYEIKRAKPNNRGSAPSVRLQSAC
jgi:diguanylate cyclase (GGDEF)-like protein